MKLSDKNDKIISSDKHDKNDKLDNILSDKIVIPKISNQGIPILIKPWRIILLE